MRQPPVPGTLLVAWPAGGDSSYSCELYDNPWVCGGGEVPCGSLMLLISTRDRQPAGAWLYVLAALSGRSGWIWDAEARQAG